MDRANQSGYPEYAVETLRVHCPTCGANAYRPSQAWDIGWMIRHDVGCPTAVADAREIRNMNRFADSILLGFIGAMLAFAYFAIKYFS